MKPPRKLSDLNPLSLLGHGNTRRVYDDLCRRYDLVYFGHVSQHHDDHELVKGVTFSANHTDNHYVMGNIEGYDLIVVERTDHIAFPGRSAEHYRWIIVQVDLDERLQLPHVFLDARHHDQGFYQALFAKFNRLSSADRLFDSGYDELFGQKFHPYTPPDSLDDLQLYLTPDVAAVLAHHFAHFDVEWHHDKLLVYAANRTVTPHLLNTMLREAIWLARQIEAVGLERHQAPQ